MAEFINNSEVETLITIAAAIKERKRQQFVKESAERFEQWKVEHPVTHWWPAMMNHNAARAALEKKND